VAIVFTELTSGSSNTDTQTYVTGSFSIADNELVTVWVLNGKSVSGTAGTVTVTGHSMTWVSAEDQLGAFNALRLTMLRAAKTGVGTTTGTLTITVSGTQNSCCNWVVVKTTGVVVTTNGGDGIDQVADESGYASSMACNLTAFANPANATIAGFAIVDTSLTITAEAGYIQSTQQETFLAALRVQWLSGTDENPVASWGSLDLCLGISAELINSTPGSTLGARAYGYSS